MSLGVLEYDLQVFARPKTNGGTATTFENTLFFNEENFTLGLKKGTLSSQSDLDLAWVMQYARGEETADLEGLEVFEFLAELAMKENTEKNPKATVAPLSFPLASTRNQVARGM